MASLWKTDRDGLGTDTLQEGPEHDGTSLDGWLQFEILAPQETVGQALVFQLFEVGPDLFDFLVGFIPSREERRHQGSGLGGLGIQEQFFEILRPEAFHRMGQIDHGRTERFPPLQPMAVDAAKSSFAHSQQGPAEGAALVFRETGDIDCHWRHPHIGLGEIGEERSDMGFREARHPGGDIGPDSRALPGDDALHPMGSQFAADQIQRGWDVSPPTQRKGSHVIGPEISLAGILRTSFPAPLMAGVAVQRGHGIVDASRLVGEWAGVVGGSEVGESQLDCPDLHFVEEKGGHGPAERTFRQTPGAFFRAELGQGPGFGRESDPAGRRGVTGRAVLGLEDRPAAFYQAGIDLERLVCREGRLTGGDGHRCGRFPAQSLLEFRRERRRGSRLQVGGNMVRLRPTQRGGGHAASRPMGEGIEQKADEFLAGIFFGKLQRHAGQTDEINLDPFGQVGGAIADFRCMAGDTAESMVEATSFIDRNLGGGDRGIPRERQRLCGRGLPQAGQEMRQRLDVVEIPVGPGEEAGHEGVLFHEAGIAHHQFEIERSEPRPRAAEVGPDMTGEQGGPGGGRRMAGDAIQLTEQQISALGEIARIIVPGVKPLESDDQGVIDRLGMGGVGPGRWRGRSEDHQDGESEEAGWTGTEKGKAHGKTLNNPTNLTGGLGRVKSSGWGARRLSPAGTPFSALQRGRLHGRYGLMTEEKTFFQDRVAVVTGAGRGIGKEIARQLIHAGAKVAVVSRTEANSAAAAEELSAEGPGTARGYAVDISNHDAVVAMGKQIGEDLGPVSILVNNAGVTRDGLALRMSEEDWNVVLDTNLKGAFNAIKAFQRTLLKQPNARIINISSVIGLMGNAGQANYAASKAGLIGLTKSLAKEFAGRGVCVNAVAPGFIVTDMTNELNEQQQEAIKKQIPLGTLGQVDDISAAVMYLAGPGGRYVTGQVLVVDGGMVM